MDSSKPEVESPKTPEWLEHAWNQETVNWFKNLNESDRHSIWEAFARIELSDYYNGTLDLSVLPGEEFCVAALTTMATEFNDEPAPKFVPSGEGDLFLEALDYYTTQSDPSRTLIRHPGWLLGVHLTRDRADALLRAYVNPVTDRSGFSVGLRDTFRYAVLTHRDIPADLATPYLAYLISRDHANSDAYYYLTVWQRYLSFPRNPEHLAYLAEAVEDMLLKVPEWNFDGNYFVNVLRHLTKHPDFPMSWVEKHNAMGYGNFPLLYASDDPQVEERYFQAYPDSVASRNRRSRTVVFPEMSTPVSVSNEKALALGKNLVDGRSAQKVIPEDLHPHTVGWYFESIRRVGANMGLEEGTIPDEWLKELL